MKTQFEIFLSFLIGVVVAGCAPKIKNIPAPLPNPLSQNWMLFSEPFSGGGTDFLGAAYSIDDGDRFSNCYAFKADSVRSSFDSIVIDWDQSRRILFRGVGGKTYVCGFGQAARSHSRLRAADFCG